MHNYEFVYKFFTDSNLPTFLGLLEFIDRDVDVMVPKQELLLWVLLIVERLEMLTVIFIDFLA